MANFEDLLNQETRRFGLRANDLREFVHKLLEKDFLELRESIKSLPEEVAEQITEEFFVDGHRDIEIDVNRIAKSYLEKKKFNQKYFRVDIEEDSLTEDCFVCGKGIDSQSQLAGMSTCKNCRETEQC